MNDWDEMDGETFRIAGLLYAVNKAVLWPIGMAIRLTTANGLGTLDVVMLKEPETIMEGKIDKAKEPGGCHPEERFRRFAEDRVAAMPTEMEQAMATKALQKILPGFGISPLRE
jgi:hypothetical protein